MLITKKVMAGIGVTMVAAALISFSSGDDNGKKKKYHIIHQKDGVLTEYDTLLEMNSSYTVENFLSDKGIDSEGVRIIEIPSGGNGQMVFHGDDGSQHVIMHKMDHEEMVFVENGTSKEVKIIRTDDGNGNVVTKKFLDGKEVEVSEEDQTKLNQRQNEGSPGRHVVIEKKVNMSEEDASHAEGEKVEMKVEIDDKGNMTVQKFVNGKEVEVSAEELQKIQSHHDSGSHGATWLTEDENGNGEIIMELEILEGELDSMINEMEFEGIDKEGNQVIIKEFHMIGEEGEAGSDEVKKQVRVYNTVDVEGDGKDFTMVIVSNDVDESMETEMRVSGMQMNAPISVYPNPNNGMFTIAFQQDERTKTSIEVVDAQGKVVFKEKLGNFAGSYRKELDLKQNGAGLYIVKVEQGNEMSSLKVVVE